MGNKTKRGKVLLAKPVKKQNWNKYRAEPGPSLGEDPSKGSVAAATDLREGVIR